MEIGSGFLNISEKITQNPACVPSRTSQKTEKTRVIFQFAAAVLHGHITMYYNFIAMYCAHSVLFYLFIPILASLARFSVFRSIFLPFMFKITMILRISPIDRQADICYYIFTTQSKM